jgi:hypothetical protein
VNGFKWRSLSVPLAFVLGALVTWLTTGSYGECDNDRDCRVSGSYCMGWPVKMYPEDTPYWARAKTYRSCEILCSSKPVPCPGTMHCVGSSHGDPPICVERN